MYLVKFTIVKLPGQDTITVISTDVNKTVNF